MENNKSFLDSIQYFISNITNYIPWEILLASGFGLVLLGFILDWDWVVEAGGGYFNISHYIEIWGRKTVRIVKGLLMVIAIVASLSLYYLNH